MKEGEAAGCRQVRHNRVLRSSREEGAESLAKGSHVGDEALLQRCKREGQFSPPVQEPPQERFEWLNLLPQEPGQKLK